MCKTHVLSVPAAKASFENVTIERRSLRPDDVLIDIKFSGICHSDIHSAHGDWAGGIFPMVPGHEISGIVTAVGEKVTKFAVGDRVGVGCYVDSCGECEYCLRGEKVAILGMGGLGHVAIQFAHAMGAEVTVLSRAKDKGNEAMSFGADHYFSTLEPETFNTLAGRFDLILNTVSATIDIDSYLSLLRVDGTLINVGAPAELSQYNVFSLIMSRRSIAGSLVGGLPETQEMLDFAAAHGITPQIEVIRADQIDEAYDRILRSDVRYRFVIDISTL